MFGGGKSCGFASRRLSRPFHGLGFDTVPIPAVNCWATIIRPLSRTFCAKPRGTLRSNATIRQSERRTSSPAFHFVRSMAGRNRSEPADTSRAACLRFDLLRVRPYLVSPNPVKNFWGEKQSEVSVHFQNLGRLSWASRVLCELNSDWRALLSESWDDA